MPTSSETAGSGNGFHQRVVHQASHHRRADLHQGPGEVAEFRSGRHRSVHIGGLSGGRILLNFTFLGVDLHPGNPLNLHDSGRLIADAGQTLHNPRQLVQEQVAPLVSTLRRVLSGCFAGWHRSDRIEAVGA